MNPNTFALRHPITVLMLAVVLISGGVLAVLRMPIDIFPPINLPQIVVVSNYGGMDPAQMEGMITNNYEVMFQYVDGLKGIESKNIQNIALIQLSFYPDTDMAHAMSQVVAMANRALHSMPPGTLPPLIMRFDAASTPIGYLVLSSKTRSLGEIGDLAMARVRPLMLAHVPGTISLPPFGTNQRAIVVNVDPDRLRAYSLSPEDVVKAVSAGNAISPSGNLTIQDQLPIVPSNTMVVDPQELVAIPLEPGRNVYLRDVATVADATDINYGYALVNGRKSVYLPVVKRDTASTLTVAADLRAALPIIKDALPDDVEVRYEFDESPVVLTAIRGVATEGLIGATLTGLMILLFLRDLRSVVVVVLNIPLALLGSLLGLWVSGHTINIMTLGGLALAIGILVDEATVEVENVHKQMETTGSVARAVRAGNLVTAVPRLLAMLCILSVFIPAFLMKDPIRSLFLPLALAVGFAMITSYVLSSTLVSVLCVWLLKPRTASPLTPAPSAQGNAGSIGGLFARLRDGFGRIVALVVWGRWAVVPLYVAGCALMLWQVGGRVGTELFPQVDAGAFVLRFRAPPGTHYEITRQIGLKCLEVIGDEAGEGNVAISMGYVGQTAPNFAVNNALLFMRGPDDGQLRVGLRPGSGIHLAELREQLRQVLPQRVTPWLTKLLQAEDVDPATAAVRARHVVFGFEPGDMVSEVMSFGSPTPIEVLTAGPDLAAVRRHATHLLAELRQVPALRDVQFYQALDYPTVPIVVDRQKAGLSGLTAEQVGQAVTVATSSSRYVAQNFWRNPRSGLDYQVQVQVPVQRMTSAAQVETIPVERVNASSSLLVRDVAKVGTGVMPGEYDRTAMQRYISITANVEGTDLGRAARQIEAAIAGVGPPPRGVRVLVRGQITPMRELFTSLAVGLAMTVAVILVLLTAYFQSLRLAAIAVSAVPGVLSGVAAMLYLSGTTLNIESFMGSIMCIGVSVSNSVMLVTFMDREWRGGLSVAAAAVAGARDRLRPILMTACAMTVGMVPMALALEEGSEMQAPLGRAVIGGLIVSTFTTLLILPAIFALVMGRARQVSPSLDPDDPSSPHYDATAAAKAVPVALVLLGVVGLSGCSPRQPAVAGSVTPVPTVHLVKPETRDLVRTVEQPGFIEAYEQTSIFAKVAGFVSAWKVDIGDRVGKDDLLATLAIPELVAEHEQKLAQVVLDEEQVKQAEKLVQVAQSNLQAATAQTAEAEANVVRYQADIERWESEVKRLTTLVKQRVVDQQVLDESSKQLKSSIATRDAARATVQSVAASQRASAAVLEKAKVDVDVARARTQVAAAEARRLAALVGYTRIQAPYDGIVVARNVNTGDFVLPATGDRSAGPTANQSPTQAAPLYVVARTDRVRIYVDVPEADASSVHQGTKARVRVPALDDTELDADVTRTSWSLNTRTRTLRAEIDLSNADARLRPGMYAYASVRIERPKALALPKSAVVELGNQTCCYLYQDGRAVKTPVQTGLSDGTWVAVVKKRVGGQWTEFFGTEEVIVGDLSEITDGQEVTVAAEPLGVALGEQRRAQPSR
jgi:RND family efflux transporter MFP subunit